MTALPMVLMFLLLGWVVPWEANVAMVLIVIVAAIKDARRWRG